MDHVAILNKQLPWLERIKVGEKTIESRWYQHKSVPWNKIAVGERIFFKNSGELVTLCSTVSSVSFYSELTPVVIDNLVKQYASPLGLKHKEVNQFIQSIKNKQFAILIGLSDVTEIPAFAINKKGFGSMAAWLSIPNIQQLIS